jgi:hypothetical protein
MTWKWRDVATRRLWLSLHQLEDQTNYGWFKFERCAFLIITVHKRGPENKKTLSTILVRSSSTPCRRLAASVKEQWTFVKLKNVITLHKVQELKNFTIFLNTCVYWEDFSSVIYLFVHVYKVNLQQFLHFRLESFSLFWRF